MLVAVIAVAVAAVVVANVVLLGYGSERSDRVGKLSPLAPSHVTRTRPTPHARPQHGEGKDLDD